MSFSTFIEHEELTCLEIAGYVTLAWAAVEFFFSSWNYSSSRLGPLQMNDKAELVAAVLTVEAVGDQD